ncbi:aromatic acid decarboxylase [Paenibacillus sp. CAA11]|uniref:UbiX family flavin prenyltransferase n=1 Tax=Paenibacillus sp. CAA11 TaxID=1532905 RepID=UPI000D3BA651|nr:flavin prenyltransferase UbiX [Paenibacillus sp. CAA11]AWB45013.1 aromatic acid decarboxylase [Paenibacillus sp. CAA11]
MDNQRKRAYVVGITGASGSVYAIKLIETLLQLEYHVHLVITNAGWRVIREELNWNTTDRDKLLEEKFGSFPGKFTYHPIGNIGASIASGSYQVEGMIVMPCSMGTLSGIAHGSSDNLLTRAADVMLKEARPLVLVPRETPLHAIHLENMLKLARLGVKIVPAMPAFYFGPQTMDDLVSFLVGKVLDSLRIEHQLFTRWGEQELDTERS